MPETVPPSVPPTLHYISPKLEARVRPATGDRGVFACAPVKAGELLLVWGGDILDGERLDMLPEHARRLSVQVEENLYLVTLHPGHPGDYVNHSCDPNAGLNGQITLMALRDITVDEEICYDYAMSDGSPYDEFDCECGALNCRRRVTGNDWRRPDLQTRYAGHFSPYLQRRIDRLAQR